MRHWTCEEFTVEKDRLGSGERKKAVKRMTRLESIEWTLPSVRKMFTSANKGCFHTYMTEAFGWMNDC